MDKLDAQGNLKPEIFNGLICSQQLIPSYSRSVHNTKGERPSNTAKNGNGVMKLGAMITQLAA
jgi:hypothetical protein